MVSNAFASSDTISWFHIKAKADFKIHVRLSAALKMLVWNFKWPFRNVKLINQSMTRKDLFTQDLLMPLRWDSFLTDNIKNKTKQILVGLWMMAVDNFYPKDAFSIHIAQTSTDFHPVGKAAVSSTRCLQSTKPACATIHTGMSLDCAITSFGYIHGSQWRLHIFRTFCNPDGSSACLIPQCDTTNRILNLQGAKEYQHAYCTDNLQVDLQSTAVTNRAQNELWASIQCSGLLWNFYSPLAFYLKRNLKCNFSCNCFLMCTSN